MSVILQGSIDAVSCKAELEGIKNHKDTKDTKREKFFVPFVPLWFFYFRASMPLH